MQLQFPEIPFFFSFFLFQIYSPEESFCTPYLFPAEINPIMETLKLYKGI
jgi:hypothetical protein